MFMLLSVLALCFLSEITLFAIFDNAEAFGVLATNINHQSTIRLQQPRNKTPFVCNKKTKQQYVVSHETKHKKTPHACSTVKTIQIYNTRHLLQGTA